MSWAAAGTWAAMTLAPERLRWCLARHTGRHLTEPHSCWLQLRPEVLGQCRALTRAALGRTSSSVNARGHAAVPECSPAVVHTSDDRCVSCVQQRAQCACLWWRLVGGHGPWPPGSVFSCRRRAAGAAALLHRQCWRLWCPWLVLRGWRSGWGPREACSWRSGHRQGRLCGCRLCCSWWASPLWQGRRHIGLLWCWECRLGPALHGLARLCWSASGFGRPEGLQLRARLAQTDERSSSCLADLLHTLRRPASSRSRLLAGFICPPSRDAPAAPQAHPALPGALHRSRSAYSQAAVRNTNKHSLLRPSSCLTHRTGSGEQLVRQRHPASALHSPASTEAQVMQRHAQCLQGCQQHPGLRQQPARLHSCAWRAGTRRGACHRARAAGPSVPDQLLEARRLDSGEG